MTKGTKKSFAQHQKDREQKRHVKLYERELKSKRAQELEVGHFNLKLYYLYFKGYIS